MLRRSVLRQWLAWTAGLVIAVTVAVIAFGAAIDAGLFRGMVIRVLASQISHPVAVAGKLKVHVLSLHPRLSAERVAIGNPSWTAPGSAAEIGNLTLELGLPWFGTPLSVTRLEFVDATLHLARDEAGHANWNLHDPGSVTVSQSPLVRSFTMRSAHVELDDARLHLKFEGTVSAQDAVRASGVRPLRIDGAGNLNGRPVTFGIDGDSLQTASHSTPYHFAFQEQSGESHLVGTALLPRPFDFTQLEAAFAIDGPDLKDAYFLAGLSLIHTPSYHFTGRLSRRGSFYNYNDLALTFGHSDVGGNITSDTSSGRPKLQVDAVSRVLRMADLGARSPGATKTLLLSDAVFSPAALRHGDAHIRFRGEAVTIGPVKLEAMTAKMTLDQGVLAVAPLTARVLDGKLTGRLRIDAKTNDPFASVDVRLTDLQLGALGAGGPKGPPIDGHLHAHLKLDGRGRSMHQVAATATGTASAVLLRGTLREALAELSGVDLRALGLLISKSPRQTPIRCAVASVQAHRGRLDVERLVIDTVPMLIDGSGSIQLDDEALDLEVRGHPKKLRLLRLHSPVVIRGTLAHPLIAVRGRSVVPQAAAAITLGLVVPPLGAVLAFIDPGLAQDADCPALLAATAGEGKH